jgi:hypothetical protein
VHRFVSLIASLALTLSLVVGVVRPTAAQEAPTLTAYCTNPMVAYTVAFPGDWFTNPRVEGEGAANDVAACRFFSAQEFTVTPGSEPSGNIAIGFFPQSGSVGDGEPVVVDGLQAIRDERGAAGDRVYLYNISVAAGRILSVQTHEAWAGDYAQNKAILDRQMAGIELHPFTDVTDTQFVWDIAWLYDEGITVGCSEDMYCPRGLVTRQQMASFLVRALDLPASATDHFGDDDDSQHEADINALAAAGITVGCAEDRFCPGANVQRGQMASFVARALDLPEGSADFFADDNANQHERNINRLAEAGIARGCGDGAYCPNDVITRGQMAAFLHRALS